MLIPGFLEVVEANPANYTGWQYRRRCLEALGSDLVQELRFTEESAYDNPKNYQIWFHRRAVVKLLGDPSAELAFVGNVLLEDGKSRTTSGTPNNRGACSEKADLDVAIVTSQQKPRHLIFDGAADELLSLLLSRQARTTTRGATVSGC